jgi:hypothetical protein
MWSTSRRPLPESRRGAARARSASEHTGNRSANPHNLKPSGTLSTALACCPVRHRATPCVAAAPPNGPAYLPVCPSGGSNSRRYAPWAAGPRGCRLHAAVSHRGTPDALAGHPQEYPVSTPEAHWRFHTAVCTAERTAAGRTSAGGHCRLRPQSVPAQMWARPALTGDGHELQPLTVVGQLQRLIRRRMPAHSSPGGASTRSGPAAKRARARTHARTHAHVCWRRKVQPVRRFQSASKHCAATIIPRYR